MRKSKILLTIFTLILTFVVLVGCNTTAKAESYVILDINPSVELVLNDNNQVQYANALNDDAKVLLENIELENKDMEEAVEIIIDESTNLGYIDPEAEETVVEVTTVTEDEDEEKLNERIRSHVDKTFMDRGMRGIGKKKAMTADIIAEAKELGVAPGFLRLIKITQEINPDLTMEEALEMKVKDLISIVKEQGSELRDLNEELRSEFMAARNETREKYRPQIEELEIKIEELNVKIEAEVDEEAKNTLLEELAGLEKQLKDLVDARNAEIKALRDSYKEQVQSLKKQMKETHQAKIQEHKQQVDKFKEEFQKNREAKLAEIEEWREGKYGKGHK